MKSETKGLQLFTVWSFFLLIVAFSEYTLLFALIVVFFWFQFWADKTGLRLLQICRQFTPHRLFENENFTLRIHWKSSFFRPISLLLEPCEVKAGLELREWKLTIAPHEEGSHSFRGAFFSYGTVSPGPIRLLIRHPLGLYRVRRWVDPKEKIIVFPRLPELAFQREALKVPLPGRKTSTRLLEDTSDMLKVRPYEREPWNRIHWKISAKLDQWMVKEFVYSASGVVHILLDLNQPASIYAREVWSMYRRQFESYAIRACARFLFHFQSRRIPLSLTITGDQTQHIPLGLRDAVEDLEVLLQQTGSSEAHETVLDYFTALHVPLRPSDTVLLLGMHLDLDQLPGLISLRQRCAKIMALLFPYGYREENVQPGVDRLSAHPQAKELLKLANDLALHHIHLRFLSPQQTLQEACHAFS